MSLTALDFERLGFWEDETPEDKITIYGMDFEDHSYVVITDDNGKTPLEPKTNLVLACYDNNDCYVWGSEFKSFEALAQACQGLAPGSKEMLEALKSSSTTLKEYPEEA